MSSTTPPPTVPEHQIVEDGACRRRLEIQIPAVEVEKEILLATRHLARGVRLPGFRKGKVPDHLVRKRYAAEVEAEAVERLAGRHVRTVLEHEGLDPVVSPVLDKHDYRSGQVLNMVVRFEIEPVFEVGGYRDLTVDRPDSSVPESDVDTALESVRQGMARLRTVEDRGAADGDDVVVDLHGEHLEGPETGETFHRTGIALVIGTEQVHPDLSGALKGARAGEEKSVSIRYPDDYRTPDLAGRTIRYALTVTAVRERELPELGDDMAREAGDCSTLAELRRQVRTDLEQRKAAWADERVREGVIRQLLERHRFEVPQALVDREVQRRLQDLARELTARNVDPEQAGVDWREEWKRLVPKVEADLRTARILDAVADKEPITVPEEDIAKLAEKEARRTKKNPLAVRAAWRKEGRWGALEKHLRRDRVLDFLASFGHIETEGE